MTSHPAKIDVRNQRLNVSARKLGLTLSDSANKPVAVVFVAGDLARLPSRQPSRGYAEAKRKI